MKQLLCSIRQREKKLMVKPIETEVDLKTAFSELKDARAKVSMLLKEIINEMNAKGKKGILWRNDQCECWLVYKEACDKLGGLREKYGV